jgi:hypothetical protein
LQSSGLSPGLSEASFARLSDVGNSSRNPGSSFDPNVFGSSAIGSRSPGRLGSGSKPPPGLGVGTAAAPPATTDMEDKWSFNASAPNSQHPSPQLNGAPEPTWAASSSGPSSLAAGAFSSAPPVDAVGSWASSWSAKNPEDGGGFGSYATLGDSAAAGFNNAPLRAGSAPGDYGGPAAGAGATGGLSLGLAALGGSGGIWGGGLGAGDGGAFGDLSWAKTEQKEPKGLNASAADWSSSGNAW